MHRSCGNIFCAKEMGMAWLSPMDLQVVSDVPADFAGPVHESGAMRTKVCKGCISAAAQGGADAAEDVGDAAQVESLTSKAATWPPVAPAA